MIYNIEPFYNLHRNESIVHPQLPAPYWYTLHGLPEQVFQILCMYTVSRGGTALEMFYDLVTNRSIFLFSNKMNTREHCVGIIYR